MSTRENQDVHKKDTAPKQYQRPELYVLSGCDIQTGTQYHVAENTNGVWVS